MQEFRNSFVKPMVCGISGYCVGSGLELAMFCDLRVIEEDACLGFFNRRFGVPLSQLGASRLVLLIGLSRALDLLMTGRLVSAKEAFDYGLGNRIVAPGTGLTYDLSIKKGKIISILFSTGTGCQFGTVSSKVSAIDFTV